MYSCIVFLLTEGTARILSYFHNTEVSIEVFVAGKESNQDPQIHVINIFFFWGGEAVYLYTCIFVFVMRLQFSRQKIVDVIVVMILVCRVRTS